MNAPANQTAPTNPAGVLDQLLAVMDELDTYLVVDRSIGELERMLPIRDAIVAAKNTIEQLLEDAAGKDQLLAAQREAIERVAQLAAAADREVHIAARAEADSDPPAPGAAALRRHLVAVHGDQLALVRPGPANLVAHTDAHSALDSAPEHRIDDLAYDDDKIIAAIARLGGRSGRLHPDLRLRHRSGSGLADTTPAPDRGGGDGH